MITILAAIARRLGLLEVHEPPLPPLLADDWERIAEQSRRETAKMRAAEATLQFLYTDTVARRADALSPLAVEALFEALEDERCRP